MGRVGSFRSRNSLLSPWSLLSHFQLTYPSLSSVQRKVATHHLSVNQTTYVNDFENVSCCDVNDRFHFLALGLSTGSVVVYHLHLDVIESGDDTKLQFGLEMVALFDPHQHNLVPQSLALDDVHRGTARRRTSSATGC